MPKAKRWNCAVCLRRKCVFRDGQTSTVLLPRPKYECLCCGNRHTVGHKGYADDPQGYVEDASYAD